MLGPRQADSWGRPAPGLSSPHVPICILPQKPEDPRLPALGSWPRGGGKKKGVGARVSRGCGVRVHCPAERTFHPPSVSSPAPPPSLPSSRPQSPPSARLARSPPRAPALPAGCRRGSGRARLLRARAAPAAVGSVRPAAARRDGATFLWSRDGSGTTWKTSLGQTAETPGTGGRGGRGGGRALAGHGCPRTS